MPVRPPEPRHYNLEYVQTVNVPVNLRKDLIKKVDEDAAARGRSREQIIHEIVEKYYA